MREIQADGPTALYVTLGPQSELQIVGCDGDTVHISGGSLKPTLPSDRLVEPVRPSEVIDRYFEDTTRGPDALEQNTIRRHSGA
jgi:hypothetical protein